MNNNIDFLKAVNKNKDKSIILLGNGLAGTMFLYYKYLDKVDYIVRTHNDDSNFIQNIEVINLIDLENIDSKMLILLCLDVEITTMQVFITSIFKDLCKLKIDADVFNFFGNVAFFNNNTIQSDGKVIQLFNHPYNCGDYTNRMTERSLELALLKEWMSKKSDSCSFYEIGAVSPYYFYDSRIKKIIDPTDKNAFVTDSISLFDINLISSEEKNHVFSISTVEHIGTHDYGLNECKTSLDAINKIMNESKSCFITFPINYNQLLDNWLKDQKQNPMVSIYKRKLGNEWVLTDSDIFDEMPYSSFWANGLCVIKN